MSTSGKATAPGPAALTTILAGGSSLRGAEFTEEMTAFMQRIVALEDEMEATGTFVFGGALHGPTRRRSCARGAGDPITATPTIDYP